MLDISHWLVAGAMAQTADAAPTAPDSGFGMDKLMSFAPFILIFAVMYLIVIRPQQKKMDEQAKMHKALQRGDRIVTTGGIHGKITKVESDDALMIEIADGVQIKLARAHVQALAVKTPVANGNDNSAAKSA